MFDLILGAETLEKLRIVLIVGCTMLWERSITLDSVVASFQTILFNDMGFNFGNGRQLNP
jgi:hypothetical protein